MITDREILQIERAANIRVMGTDTLAGMKRIDADIELRMQQVSSGLITITEATTLIKRG